VTAAKSYALAPAASASKLTKAKRSWLVRGESYRIPGSFRVTLTRAGAGRAEVRFRQKAAGTMAWWP
jgi:hypothetical protein